MKKIFKKTIILPSIYLLSMTLNHSTEIKDSLEVSKFSALASTSLSSQYTDMIAPYLEKGILYVGIALFLLIVWLILKYIIQEEEDQKTEETQNRPINKYGNLEKS